MGYGELVGSKAYGGKFTIYEYKHGVELDIEDAYTDYYGNYGAASVDAVEVYNILKEYFKGTEHE